MFHCGGYSKPGQVVGVPFSLFLFTFFFFLASDAVYYQHSDRVPKVVGSRKVNKPQFSFLNSLDK